MSRGLGEEVTWDDQKVTSVDWRTYHSLPLGFEIPKIECVLLNRPDEEATGAGETVDHGDRRRHRQRDLRRHRRAPAPDSVYQRQDQSRAPVARLSAIFSAEDRPAR